MFFLKIFLNYKKELIELSNTQLKFKDIVEKSNQTCPICLLDFEKEDDVSKLQCCKTTFHFKCLNKWLSECNHSCPNCRCEFEKDEEKII